MDSPEEDVYTIAGRLATFERPHHFAKRRASQNSKKKAQPTSITWPHTSPSPEQLARAGFYYKPSSTSHDSVSCFLCDKALDGWDPEDNPALEHLSHVPNCGWAINVCIEQQTHDAMDPRAEEHPLGDKMLEARRATFRDAWPHQSKKGWKCKVEKMIEAGWCYNPLPEADDCVQCFYCGVSLDGWEPKDDPWDEHQRRAPDCHFFSLVSDRPKSKPASKPKAASKAKPKAKATRTSKASRASTQSNLTQISDAPSLDLDNTLATQGDDLNDDTVLTAVSTTSKASTKGRKKAPTAKSRTRASKKPSTLDDSSMQIVGDTDVESTQQPEPVTELSLSVDMEPSNPPTKKPRATRTKKASTSKGKPVLNEEPDENLPLVDDSVTSLAAAESLPQPKTRAKKQPSKKIDAPAEDIVQELNPDPEPVDVPAPTRKVSKAKSSKKKAAAETEEQTEPAEEAPKNTKRGKKRTSEGVEKPDNSVIVVSEEARAEATQPKPSQPKRGRAASRAAKKPVEPETAPEHPSQVNNILKDRITEERKTSTRATRASRQPDAESDAVTRPAEPVCTDEPELQEQLPQEQAIAVAPPAEIPLPSAASSPQSSDAENHPPSSRPSVNAAPEQFIASPIRVPLKPSTPTASPSKRNMIAGGLTSTVPWTAVDLETIFLPSPNSRAALPVGEDKENTTAEAVMLNLTSPEKQMSVEEWILWNAGRAENKLKVECERLIGVFEGEGVRALQALEGVEHVS